MKKTEYTCDSCGKFVNSQFLNNFVVLYQQGTPQLEDFNQFSKNFLREYWKHKVVYKQMICEECAGTPIDHKYGDNNSGVNFKVLPFLRKIGLVKEATNPN